MKTRVLLDTNFLMMPYKDHVDIFQEIGRLMASDQEYEIAVPASVKRELETLAVKDRGENKVAAKLGLQLLEQKNVPVIESPPDVRADDDILRLAEDDRQIVVCTNDKLLKTELRKKGVSVMTMRSKSHLAYV